MRIVITGPKTCPPEIGGIEVFSFELGKRLSAKELEVWLICARRPGQSSHEVVHGVNVRRCRALWNRYTLKLSMIPGIHSGIEEIRPDVVHANDATSSWTSTALLGHTPTVVTLHGVGFSRDDWPTPFRQGIRYMQTRAVRKATIVVATDTLSAEAFSDCRDDIRVIPPGVDTEVFKRGCYARPDVLGEDKLNLLFVGRLTRVKGFDLIVESVKHLDSSIKKNLRITVIGNGPLDRLAERASRNGVLVNCIGDIPHEKLPPYFTNADALILPSRSEGLSITLLEAMASRLPVIASSVGGMKTLLNSDNSTTITSLSSEGVAEAIGRSLSDDKERRARTDSALRLVAERYSWSAVTEKYLEAYKSAFDHGSLLH